MHSKFKKKKSFISSQPKAIIWGNKMASVYQHMRNMVHLSETDFFTLFFSEWISEKLKHYSL